MKNYILIILLTLISACKKNAEIKNQKEEKNEITKIDLNHKVEKVKLSIPENVDSEFELFLKYFNADSIFQISRVKFPVKATVINYDDYETVEKVINLDNYEIINLTNNSSSETKEFDKYSQEIIKEKTKATIEIRGIENGIHCDFEFKKIDGKWNLITWRDLST